MNYLWNVVVDDEELTKLVKSHTHITTLISIQGIGHYDKDLAVSLVDLEELINDRYKQLKSREVDSHYV